MRIRSTKPAPTYKKRNIPAGVRRAVLVREGALFEQRVGVKCAYCQAPGFIEWSPVSKSWPTTDLELDHIKPEYLGGLSVPENLCLACRACNRRKGWRGRL